MDDARHRLQIWPVAGHLDRCVIIFPIRDGGLLGVLRNIHQHRAWPAGARNIESLAHGRHNIFHPGNQIIVLGNGQGNAGHIRFLKSVIPDKFAGYLAGNKYYWHRIHLRCGDAGHQVRGAWARGGDSHAHPAAHPCVAVGHMGAALFVARQDMVDRIIQHGVVKRQVRAAGVAKYHLHAFLGQTFPDNLCTSTFHVLLLWEHFDWRVISHASNLASE